jgi:hypothetical protein
MLAHTLGNPFDVDAVMEFSGKKHNLWVIEDCCVPSALSTKGARLGPSWPLLPPPAFIRAPHHHGRGRMRACPSPALKEVSRLFSRLGP